MQSPPSVRLSVCPRQILSSLCWAVLFALESDVALADVRDPALKEQRSCPVSTQESGSGGRLVDEASASVISLVALLAVIFTLSVG